MAGAAIGVVVAIAAVGTVILRSSDDKSEPQPIAQPTSTPPTTPSVDSGVPVTALPNLLLTPAELNAALGTSRFEAAGPPSNELPPFTTSHPQCGSVGDVGLRSAYEGSGYRAVQFQYGHSQAEPSGDPVADAFGSTQVNLGQMVTAFPDDAAASRFAADQVGKWRQCIRAGVISVISEGQPSADFRVGEVRQNDKYTVQGVLTVELQNAGQQLGNWNCFHSLGVQRNIVADLNVCDGQVKHKESAKLVQRILDKVPAK
ncbi:sensor domain-containing protein [Mycolicibacterium fortuitum]|uniref:sensor domain-containing protein n=1 Tax=Mycolicibacterium fortuitum TaxID=1766 RepID=UPI0013F61757|nr:sensor domain-containing protein [Mycolicibacterium fortuitum]